MANNEWIPIVDYLRSNTDFHHDNFLIIRDQYEQQCGGSFPELYNECAGEEVARQLKIKLNTEECLDLFRDCVMSSNVKDSRTLAESTWKTRMELHSTIIINRSCVSFGSPPTILTDIDCLLTIKMAHTKVATFIRSFLLKPIGKSTVPDANVDQQSFVLDVRCPLYLFIRQQIHERDPTMSNSDHHRTRFRLVEPISTIDEFSPWSYDHWHGLFDLEMVPHGDHAQFPERWCLKQDVKIHCRIGTCDAKDKNSHSSHIDEPRTTTLEIFIHDVCKREKNGQEESWLKALREEDIFTFEHLNNLNQSEWDRIRHLSVNAKRILKAAVDHKRTSIAGERRQQIIDEPDDENKQQTETVSVDDSSMTDSELLANLHLIKLFLWHKLRDQPSVQRHGALAKLEMKCLNLAFDEMLSEGYADDGLFPQIREFFLPLTISEQELLMERSSNQDIRETRCKELRTMIDLHTSKLKEMNNADRKCDEDLVRIEKKIKDHESEYLQVLETWRSKKNNKKQQKQLETLHRAYQDSLKEQDHYLKQRQKLKQDKEKIQKKIVEYTNNIEATKARLQAIEAELNTPHKPVQKQLVKPPRGLIMYGPPGTGKSDILGKLAKKLGILMVGPPLAAGELNRSLVGESERIIIALCSRCYQVPYAMCCVSIDEIDSLAPKRDEDSSEGKVDKISVLLSLIDGIKDIPNFMILSATNRLHMMDEAFLRRMAGKFFVGRPSSHARLSMLQKIPCWALEPELLDGLSKATTNFSGAAVKALTREITVKCIEKQRTDSKYQIGEIEALEITDRIAKQYQIFIGSETLPCLFKRNKQSNNDHHSHTYHLPVNYKYTGRMIVDLHSKHIRIEYLNKTSQSSVIEHDLYPNETNVQTLLERLATYGKNRNVQLLQLIDLNLLASQGAYDEKKVYETLKDRYDECVSYTRSMIVYDLDALVGVNKSESDSTTGLSNTKSIHNQSIYTYVLARFRDRAMEEADKNGKDNVERWAVVVIREPFLLRQFSLDAQYPRTHEEEEQDKSERRKAEDILKCVKCQNFYIENENKMGTCTHHDGFVYDSEAADMTIYTPSEVAKILRKLEHKIIKSPERREELEMQTKRLKWICCDETFTNVRTGGCKQGKHGFVPNGNDSINGGITRLNQTLIEQWEETCRNNQEYNEKWLLLAQEY